ncbi:hypothetical protein IRZ71_11195 [Flavobacterium sp. ANB]|uniref:hypothetical protein n=1 Tax=unclassified Flavobacterium TaxID=196869 RepID=UPI0012B9AB5B|nr:MULTISPECIES: hypothetical protein [unclassified Flavobacterium]MBF4516917.1 hypothetical protein [Flavobacterium sp. ANB]MTD69187.1 hypothetical protein [Flavobacterium sp. LC2016-13]
MDTLPLYIALVFGVTLLTSIVLFYKATHFSKTVLAVILLWIIVQSIISLTGFYKTENTSPPRFALLLMPPLLTIILLFITEKGKQFIDGLNIKILTIIHIIRIPVELVLFWLFMQKAIPELMTFEGRNFDIVSGISAPLVYYFTFVKKKTNTKFLLIWNFICLALVINIAINAVLSLSTRFQQFAFDQPNVALLEFPFTLLPAVLVPIVVFSHLVSIRQLLSEKD